MSRAMRLQFGQSHKGLHSLAKRYMWRCYYCREMTHCATCEPRIPRQRAATRDHYYPRSRGGGSQAVNIVLACFQCNQLKADSATPTRWVIR
jgi:5-methylcytosine-specific restriction endonuclease McrA